VFPGGLGYIPSWSAACPGRASGVDARDGFVTCQTIEGGESECDE